MPAAKRPRTFSAADRQRFEQTAEHYLDGCFRTGQRVRVNRFAGTLDFTPQYASWLGAQLLGMPLLDWLRARQVDYAETLLQRKALSVAEVAVKAGFSSIRSLQRAFRSLRGITPRETRS